MAFTQGSTTMLNKPSGRVSSKPTISMTTVPIASAPLPATGWGNMFPSKEGGWKCDNCYIMNGADAKTCMSCAFVRGGEESGMSGEGKPESRKDTSGPPAGFESSNAGLLGSSLGMATVPVASAPLPATGWGNMFPSNWKCDNCYIMNGADAKTCMSCAFVRGGETH